MALAYAASRADKVARLILDSPIALGVNAEAAAEQQVKGQQAALNAFAAQCLAVNCALGPDPKGAVSALLADARAGKGPGGASVAEVANAITVALGFPSGGRVSATTSLANALAAARSGDTNQLNSLINHADATQDSDGQFVNSCSDAINRPTPDRVRELVVAWGKLYPQFGTVAALNLVNACTGPLVRRRRRRRSSRSTSCCRVCRTTRSWVAKGSPRQRPRSSTQTRPASG